MEYSGKMKKSFDEIYFTQTDFRNIPEEAKKFGLVDSVVESRKEMTNLPDKTSVIP